MEDRIRTLLLLFKLIAVNNQFSCAKRTCFTSIPRPSGLGYQHHRRQYQYHSFM